MAGWFHLVLDLRGVAFNAFRCLRHSVGIFVLAVVAGVSPRCVTVILGLAAGRRPGRVRQPEYVIQRLMLLFTWRGVSFHDALGPTSRSTL